MFRHFTLLRPLSCENLFRRIRPRWCNGSGESSGNFFHIACDSKKWPTWCPSQDLTNNSLFLKLPNYDVHVTVRRVKFLIIKPTRYTNYSDLFLEWNSSCFGQFFCPSSGVFHCTHSNGICHTGLLTACEQGQDGTAVTSWYCSQAVSVTSMAYTIAVRTVKNSWWWTEEVLIIKPTRYTNYSDLFLEWNSACFGQFFCPSSGVFHCTHSNRYMSYRFADSLRAGSGWNGSYILILLASSQHKQYDIYHCCVYSEKLPMMDRGSSYNKTN